LAVNGAIAAVIDFKLAYPKGCVRRGRFAPIKPSAPMPKVAVDKDRKPRPPKTDVRPTRNPPIVPLKAQAALPQCVS